LESYFTYLLSRFALFAVGSLPRNVAIGSSTASHP